MTLEMNIERIADALEAVAEALGVKADTEARPQSAAEQGAAFQAGRHAGSGFQMQLSPQGGWLPQAPQAVPGSGQPSAPGSGQPPRAPSAVPGSSQPPQGGQVPVSMAAGGGMQWPGTGNPPSRQQPAPGRVPTTASAKQYTFDQLAVAAANLASSGGDVFTVLGKFGVSMLMDLPPEKYGEYAAALREAGAVI